MSNAICTKCGREYNWPARRGSKLIDNPSPCCHASGRAVGNHKAPPTKVCPDCGKAGLWYRKAMLIPELYHQRMKLFEGELGGEMYTYLYCPRCEKWVKPVCKG